MKYRNGFTLIEVLLALSIIAIALSALLKANGQSIRYKQQLKEKTISHWVAKQGIQLIQSGEITIPPGQEVAEVTTMFNQKWYWKARLYPTPLKKVKKITVRVGTTPTGSYVNELHAYKYTLP